MDQQKIKKQQQDRLREHIIKQKEIEIKNLEVITKTKIKKLKREIKYLKGINN